MSNADGAVRAYVIIGTYAFAVFFIGALTTVPVYQQLSARGIELEAMHEWTADWLKILALLAIPALLFVVRSQWREGLGLNCGGRGLRRMGMGFALGAITMALACALLLGFEVRVPRHGFDMAMLGEALWKAAFTAALVSVIEELWFRGALHRVLRPVGPLRATLVVACIYTALHFIRPDVSVAPPHGVLDGFTAIGGLFERFGQVRFLDSALALLMVGLMLGWLRERHGCIAACVGCHAGWVFVLQLTRRSTQSEVGTQSWLVGHYDGIVGGAFIAVLLTTVVLWCARDGLLVRRARSQAQGE